MKIINPKLVMVLIVLIALGAIFLNWKSGLPEPKSVTPLQPLAGAKLALVADKTAFTVGEEINLSLRVFTGGFATDGADIIIKFDPSMFEISNQDITTGEIYGEYPLVNVEGDIISLSGITVSGEGFSGLGEIAKLKLKAKKQGTVTLSFVYKSGETGDSNVMTRGRDNLTGVSDLSLEIKDEAQGINKSCSSRTYQTCTENDQTGVYWCSGLLDPSGCNMGCFKEEGGLERGCKVN